MTARLLSIGTARPATTLDQSHYLAIARRLAPPDLRLQTLETLTRRTEIAERGCCVLTPSGETALYHRGPGEQSPSTRERLSHYTTNAAELGHAAARDALTRAGVAPGAVTHLVTASCTGFEAPGFDQAVIDRLGLRPTVRRTHVGFMGCHAAINALAVAAAFAQSDPAATVLVCCAEICSLHYHFTDRVDQMISNALFADGAGAAVISAHGPPDSPTLAGFASCLFPDTADLMSWRIGDHGFEMTLAPAVPAALERHVPDWLRAALDQSALKTRDIGGWAIHPGGPRIVRAVAGALGLSDSQTTPSLDVLRASGNMSSPTVLFILRRLWDSGVDRPWLSIAFGPGLAGEMVLIR